MVVAGADRLSHYEEILDGVLYVNSRPEELNSRTFLLSCTELNGRFVSNQLSVTVSPKAALSPPIHNSHRLNTCCPKPNLWLPYTPSADALPSITTVLRSNTAPLQAYTHNNRLPYAQLHVPYAQLRLLLGS